MYANVQSQVRLNGHYIQEFGVKVGVYQCPVLSPLLYFLCKNPFCVRSQLCAMGPFLHRWYIAHRGHPGGVSLPSPMRGRLEWKIKDPGSTWKNKFFVSDFGHDVINSPASTPVLSAQVLSAEAHGVPAMRVVGPQEVQWHHTKRWISTAPCLMWRPLSATLVAYCTPVWAVTVPYR